MGGGGLVPVLGGRSNEQEGQAQGPHRTPRHPLSLRKDEEFRQREAAFHMGSTVQEDILQQLEILHREAEAALAQPKTAKQTRAGIGKTRGGREGSREFCATWALRLLESGPLLAKGATES